MKLPALYMKFLAKTVTFFMLARPNETNHVIDWANSRILKTESKFSKRLTAESWFILSRPKVINRSDGESFPIVYRSLL